MDARRPCPDSALLAAFLDGTLADYERTAVVTHLAECAECRAVAVTVVEFREVEALDAMMDGGARPVPPPPLLLGGMTGWTRRKTRAPALALALVLLAALTTPASRYFDGFVPARSAQQAVSTLIDVAAGPRPVEARLSGIAAYAPPPRALATVPRGDNRLRVQLVATAATIRRTYAHDDNPPSRRAVGVAALLVGDLDDAIATLEIASSGAPDNLHIANDLAAAYYERAQRANRPDDLPAALSAVERVLYEQPENHEALFNRALVITALGLRREAEEAWRAYMARDAASPWAAEARERLSDLASVRQAPPWSDLKRALQQSNQASDAELAVRHHTSACRDYVENILLNEWLSAAKARDAERESNVLERMRVMAIAFAQHVPDLLYLDLVKVLDNARQDPDSGTRAAVVVAHERLVAGLGHMAGNRLADAERVLTRAARELRASGSPLLTRAQIELAAIDYYMLRHAAAAQRLPILKAQAQRQRYSILATRAAWVQGLVAFAVTDFELAQQAYEEMLSSAAAAGDTDQWLWAAGLLANLHDVLGDGARAWTYRIDAARRFEAAFSPAARVANLASSAGDASAGNHHAAALLFNSVLLSSGAAVRPNMAVQVQSQLARSLYALGRHSDALRAVAVAREHLAQIADVTGRERVEVDLLGAEAEVFLQTDAKRAALAAERALSLPLLNQDDLRRARFYLQLSTAMMRDGQLDGAETAVTRGLAALDAFRANRSAEFAVRASDDVWRLFSTAAQLALRRGDVKRAFAYSERGRLRTPSERRTWGAEIASVEAIQSALAADAAVVVLSQYEHDLQIWVLRRETLTTHAVTLTSARAAGLVAAHLNEMIGSARSPRVSAELYDAILRPISPALAKIRHLVVIADAPYNRIAFAGLWDRTQNRYVVEERSVVVAPTATSYLWAASRARERRVRSTGRQASLLNAAFEQQSTAATEKLLRGLSDVYGARQVRQNQEATATRFAEEISTGDIVHVTARIVSNDDYPSLSHVVLSDDPARRYSGAVFARDVGESTPVRAQLITLQDGNAGPLSPRAEGSLSFARALIAAGVPAVVSSTTPVAAATLDRTWLDFHRHYASGEGPAESLRRAQLSALAQTDHRPGPWATLTVFGSTQ